MGADLYVKDLPRKTQMTGYKTSTKAGYFRDCYNSHGLFTWLTNNTKMEMSWWKILDDHDDWFRQDEDDGCVMTVAGSKEFLKLLLKAEKQFVKNKKFFKVAEVQAVGMKLEYTFENQTQKETLEYFKWFGELLQVVESAIKRKSEIIWSV